MPVLEASGDVTRVLEFLRREPVLNTVPLGLFGEARDPEKRRNWFLATVERNGDIVAADVGYEPIANINEVWFRPL